MHRDQKIDYSQIAVFYRINAMSRLIEEALFRAHIPYQIIKGLEFYQRREIKDMLAYLRFLANPTDEISLLRIINRPARGIGKTTLERLIRHSRSTGRDIWTLLDNIQEVPDIPTAALSRINKFVNTIKGLQPGLKKPVTEIFQRIYKESGLKNSLEKEENQEALENVEELYNSAVDFEKDNPDENDLTSYLQQIALYSDADAYNADSGSVSLMTLHTAKGLEFSAVLIIGVEEGLIPHRKSMEGGRDKEEERRLLFVGITRAETFLALSHTQSRTMYGSSKPAFLSPFLKKLTSLETINAPFLNKGFGEDGKQDQIVTGVKISDDNLPYKPGQRVRHPRIGIGRIEQVMPDGDHSRIIVNFEMGARITLEIKLAQLEILE
jgi:DNA helicase-2/ATP-dependent DNA helicase PcrA